MIRCQARLQGLGKVNTMMSRIRRWYRLRQATNRGKASLTALCQEYVRESVRIGADEESSRGFLRGVIDRLSLSELAEMYNQCLDDGMPVVFGDVTRVGVYRVIGVTEKELVEGERSAAILRERVFRCVTTRPVGMTD